MKTIVFVIFMFSMAAGLALIGLTKNNPNVEKCIAMYSPWIDEESIDIQKMMDEMEVDTVEELVELRCKYFDEQGRVFK